MNQRKRIRVLVAKAGLDPHDRGVKVLARGLRDAGMEVIYTGLYQTPEAIAGAALQEDVDAICLSFHSGTHLSITRRVMGLLQQNKGGDIAVLCGGVIPDKDWQALLDLGIKKVFGPRTSLEESITYLKQIAS